MPDQPTKVPQEPDWESLYPDASIRAVAKARYQELLQEQQNFISEQQKAEDEIGLLKKTWNAVSGSKTRLDKQINDTNNELKGILRSAIPIPTPPPTQPTPKPEPMPQPVPKPVVPNPATPKPNAVKPAPRPMPLPEKKPTEPVFTGTPEQQLEAALKKEQEIRNSDTATSGDIARVQQIIRDLEKKAQPQTTKTEVKPVAKPAPSPIKITPTPQPMAPKPIPRKPEVLAPTKLAPEKIKLDMSPEPAKPQPMPAAPMPAPTPIQPVAPEPLQSQPLPSVPPTPAPIPTPTPRLEPLSTETEATVEMKQENRIYRSETDLIEGLKITPKGSPIYNMAGQDYNQLHVAKAADGSVYLVYGSVDDPNNPNVAHFKATDLINLPGLIESADSILFNQQPKTFNVQ